MRQRFFALSLALLMVGSFAACTQVEERNISETTIDEAPDVEEKTVVSEDTDVVERPVGTSDTQPDIEKVQQNVKSLKNLETGQTESYYQTRFKELGYNVVGSPNRQDGRRTYTLERDNQRYEVTLEKRSNQDRVQRVDARSVNQVAGTEKSKTRNQAALDAQGREVVTRIEQLQPGKRPLEYLSTFDQWGKVTEYRLSQGRATVHLEGDNNRRYRVDMMINPSRQTVTKIEAEQTRGV